MEGLLDATLSYMEFLYKEKHAIINFVQCEMWQKPLQTFNKKDGIVLPLISYFDDVETGDALGSHSGINKIGNNYVWIPCLPTNFSSKLDTILVASICLSRHRKKYGNELIFQNFIE